MKIYAGTGCNDVGPRTKREKGAFYPDISVPPELYIREVVKAGIKVEISKKVTIEA